ncbi:tonoplast intrinsic protein 5 [Prunus dulcis]|uniref:Tonoplast intrinsic protein 5 n=1 Tax=Prunus dulcis TaxID=3755 RepID=A0A4Y1R278_PRUDU|nr:tonoplast intrinsic protein 5 [Prunus dulcis]
MTYNCTNRSISASSYSQCSSILSCRVYLNLLLVFAVVGSMMSSRKLMPDAASDPASLVVVAIANALHWPRPCTSQPMPPVPCEPAVTFGMAVGGHISVPMPSAIDFSDVTVVGQHVPAYAITEEMTGFGHQFWKVCLHLGWCTRFMLLVILEMVGWGIGPLAIGLMAGANVLATGPFSGGSMNPACAFGSAVVAGSFKNQAVYWVGPLIGAAVAGLLYDNVVFPTQVPDSLTGVTEGVGKY